MIPEHELLDEYVAIDPSGAARHVDALSVPEAMAVLESIPEPTAALLLPHLSAVRASSSLGALDRDRAAALVARLPVGVGAGLLRRLDDRSAGEILDAIPEQTRRPLRTLLEFGPRTVGAAMDPLVPALPMAITAGEALALLRAHPRHVYYYVYAVDPTARLAGVLDIPELMLAEPTGRLQDIARRDVVRLLASTTLSSAYVHPAWIDYDALPVVDEDDHFLGVLRHRQVRRLISAEDAEQRGDPSLSTLLALGEIYWLGLCGVLQGLASTAASPPSHPVNEGPAS